MAECMFSWVEGLLSSLGRCSCMRGLTSVDSSAGDDMSDYVGSHLKTRTHSSKPALPCLSQHIICIRTIYGDYVGVDDHNSPIQDLPLKSSRILRSCRSIVA